MSPLPSHLQKLLGVLRHLVWVLGGMFGARLAELRARRDALPPGHRRRAGMAKELRRLAWAQTVLADPELLDDAAFRGKLAEVARVRADAGRRALVRRYIYPTPLVRLRGAAAAAAVRMEEGRCTGNIAVACCAAGGSRAAAWARVQCAHPTPGAAGFERLPRGLAGRWRWEKVFAELFSKSDRLLACPAGGAGDRAALPRNDAPAKTNREAP